MCLRRKETNPTEFNPVPSKVTSFTFQHCAVLMRSYSMSYSYILGNLTPSSNR